MRNVVRKTVEWHGVQQCETSLGWPASLPDSDAVVATTWFTAGPVAAMRTTARRLYFVQDYEPLFFPAGDLAVVAGASYDLGLKTLVIGHWLQHKLAADHAVRAWSVPFTADLSVYAVSEDRRRPRIVAIYQPDKPRRCSELVCETLRRLMDRSPVEVVTVGSERGPSLGARHRHLGLVSKSALANLYRTSYAGLCLSASNPSRVPFEMMACGLPVVELGLANNIYDLPGDGCLLARPDPQSLTEALVTLAEDEIMRSDLSSGGAEYMRARPQVAEAEAFVRFIEGHIAGDIPAARATGPVYTGDPIVVAPTDAWSPAGQRSIISRLTRD